MVSADKREPRGRHTVPYIWPGTPHAARERTDGPDFNLLQNAGLTLKNLAFLGGSFLVGTGAAVVLSGNTENAINFILSITR